MRIAMGADHAGYHLKEKLRTWLTSCGHAIVDVGAPSYDAGDDYPEYAVAVGQAVVKGTAELGIMICGTGVGSSMTLNKMHGIRAVVCSDVFTARHSRLHNDANVLCLGERVVGGGLAQELVQVWLGTPFTGEVRHQRRVKKVMAVEEHGR